MPSKKTRPSRSAVRNPDRTKQRILDAALKVFAARGFAGARVNDIARRASANKRMIYHYFGDKEGLFRAVLRFKIQDRMARVEAQLPESDAVSRMPLWFKQNCLDAGWVRLLAWESLQTAKDEVMDEKARRRHLAGLAARIRKRQRAGILRDDAPASFLLLAKTSLTMFPMAIPQLARHIIGRSPHDPRFQKEYAKFLETISFGFRPSKGMSRSKQK